MRDVSSLVKGFSRVLIAIFLLVYLVSTARVMNECREKINTWIKPQLSLETVQRPPILSWCELIARPGFLTIPAEDRINEAAGFFANMGITDEVKDCCIDKEEFKAGFINTATLSLAEAPIIEKRWPTGKISYYRDITQHSQYSGMKISKIMFASGSLTKALVISFVSTTIMILTFIIIRWIYKGFKAQSPPIIEHTEFIENQIDYKQKENLGMQCSEYEKQLRDHQNVKKDGTTFKT